MKSKVVAGAALHGEGRSHHHLGLGAGHKMDSGVHCAASAHAVRGVGCRDVLELHHDVVVGHIPLQINSLSYCHGFFLLVD